MNPQECCSCDPTSERRPEKHAAIFDAAGDLSEAVDRLRDFCNRLTNSPVPPEQNKAEVSRELSLVEVIDSAPSLIKTQTDRIDNLISEMRELLF